MIHKCDIVIPIWNQLKFTRSSIEHIEKNTKYPYRLILVDNGSDDETKKYLENLKKSREHGIYLIRNEKNLGFVKAVNQGLKASDSPYVCVLNNDTLAGIGWLTELVEFAEMHPDVGLLNPLCNGHIERCMTVNEYAEVLSSSNKGRFMEMNQCQGFAMLIKRELIEKIGLLDERFGIGGFDDTDYSRRAHAAGYKSVAVHSSYVYHREHKSFDKLGDRKLIQSEAEKGYFRKWPRHKRIAMIFSVSKDASDTEIINFLNSALFLARKWCWVNLFVFGEAKSAAARFGAIMQKIDFPMHQNIKFNFLRKSLELVEITWRILERAFGSKKRKKYDAVICGPKEPLRLLKILCGAQGTSLLPSDFHGFNEEKLKYYIESFDEAGKDKPEMKCDIILPVCDQYDFTKKCIDSILENTDTPFRLIVINNGKNPDTRRLLDKLEKDKNVETTIVHSGRNIGWVRALNKGIELSSAPYVCFQNDDTVVTAGWLGKMINTLNTEKNFGMINPAWEGRPAGVSIEKYGLMLEKGKKKFILTDWCRGFSVVMKRAVIEKIGKVNEIYGLAYFDDVDYSVSATEAGFLCLRALDTYVYHHRNATFFEVLKGEKWNELHEKNKLIYYNRWGRPLKVSIVLDGKSCREKEFLNRIEDTVFYLARKQHHIDLWSPRRFTGMFQHTNVRIRTYPAMLLQHAAFFDFFMNTKKKPEKRPNAIFSCSLKLGRLLSGDKIFAEGRDFDGFIKETVDRLKEKTKEKV